MIGSTQHDPRELEEGKPAPDAPSTHNTIARLVCYIVGLQLVYVTWGVLQVSTVALPTTHSSLLFTQERIMTGSYNGEQFTNSQFLVFCNRLLALCVAAGQLMVSHQPRHTGPFYKYSYASLSNVMSSWCQYEALKFVSFPTQVLAKSGKVIAVMMMGKLVSNKTYSWQDYIMAAMLSLGVAVFLLSADPSGHHHTRDTTIAGAIILVGYLVFDSFTSTWQNDLYRQYKMTSEQMMLGVNVFSGLLTMFSLIVRGSMLPSIMFLVEHTDCAVHILILSACSAIGQVFIYHTIKHYGAAVFTLIMTSRQALSILMSCILYGHFLTAQALVGVVIVFVTILLKVYLKNRSTSS